MTKDLKYFQKKWRLNYIIDPDINFEEIPEPYRSRLFIPSKRKRGDPIGFIKIGGKIAMIKREGKGIKIEGEQS